MHKNNIHSEGYNFEQLIANNPQLSEFVFKNKYDNLTIDFALPNAVKCLNTTLLKTYYGIKYWDFPDENLCPPIPSRVEYIHLLNDLFMTSGIHKEITVLDIGTGATCIYPLLGKKVYDWSFIASETNKKSLNNASQIVNRNNLSQAIEFRFQNNPQHILSNVIIESDKIHASMCNPPFFKNEEEATFETQRKLKGLKQDTSQMTRNFSGTAGELWYTGGEKAFLHNYLYQSSLFKTQCFWYSSLVSKKDHVKSMLKSLKKLGATSTKVLDIVLGNKKSRVVAWTFLTAKEQQTWRS